MSCYLDVEAQDDLVGRTPRRSKTAIISDDSGSELSGNESDLSLEIPLQTSGISQSAKTVKPPMKRPVMEDSSRSGKRRRLSTIEPEAENSDSLLLEELM